nr:hypothetical protein [Actinomadura harenae]
MAEELCGVALESDVGVDGGGDANVSVAEEFLDGDEAYALFQEKRRSRVLKVVERDLAESRSEVPSRRWPSAGALGWS